MLDAAEEIVNSILGPVPKEGWYTLILVNDKGRYVRTPAAAEALDNSEIQGYLIKWLRDYIDDETDESLVGEWRQACSPR